MDLKTFFLLLLLDFLLLEGADCKLDHCNYQTIFEWSRLKFSEGGEAGRGGQEEGVAVPSTVRRWAGHIYLSLPRWKDGVVATLARIPIPPPDLPLPAAPLLQPFPSLRMNLEGDCNALQNVDAIEIDPLGRLWVVDSGQTAPFSRPHRKCPPKIFVFDLANENRLVASHVPPHNRHTLFKQIVVDLSHGPSDTYAYLSDFASGRVLTFSLKSGKSWAIQTEETQPANNQFPVGRYPEFYLRSGVWGLALLGGKEDGILVGSRLGKDMFSSSTKMLKSVGVNGLTLAPKLMKPAAAGCLTSSSNDSLFLISLPTPTLYTLNYTQEGADWEAQCLLPASHPWPDSPSLDSSGHMWLVSNRFHDFSRDSLPESPLPSFAVLRLPLDQTPYMARFAAFSTAASFNKPALMLTVASVKIISYFV